MKWPWKVERKPASPAEERLEQIKGILFPPLEQHKDMNGDLMYVDATVDMNLHAIITDLEDGYNDKATRETLVDILKRVEKVRKILAVLSEFDPEAKYIIVDSKGSAGRPEDIEAAG